MARTASSCSRRAIDSACNTQEAGYHPDISKGLRSLDVGDEEEPEPQIAAQEQAQAEPRRYGTALRLVEPSGETAACATEEGLLLSDVLASAALSSHPGRESMAAWLAEEGLETGGQLQEAAAAAHPGRPARSAVAAHLLSLGFLPAWATALEEAINRHTIK